VEVPSHDQAHLVLQSSTNVVAETYSQVQTIYFSQKVQTSFWCGTRCCKQARDVSGGKQVLEMTEEVN